MRVGLASYVCWTGIGTLGRGLWRRLPFSKWLAVCHTLLGYHDIDSENGNIVRLLDHNDLETVYEFLDGLECIVSIERTWPPNLFAIAKDRGIRTVLIVMAEWADPESDCFKNADVLIAPTRHCYEHLSKLGLEHKTEYTPCPIDSRQLRPRIRETADRFAFANGYGGCNWRKGFQEIRELLRRDQGLVTVYSQTAVDGLPPGTSRRGHMPLPSDLYESIDVLVAPSRYEGVGASILEAMASGVLVITTDWPPMSEYVKGAFGDDAEHFLVRVNRVERATVSNHPWPMAIVDIDDLAGKIRALKGQSIAHFSERATSYANKVHGASAFSKLWLELLPGQHLLRV